MMKAVVGMLNALEKPLNMLLKGNMGMALKFFIILYGTMVAPQLPEKVLEKMMNPFAKMVMLSLVAYMGTKDLPTAMLLTLSFTITMLMATKLETVRSVKDVIDLPIDATQKVANRLVDGAQDLSKDVVSMVPGQIGSVVSAVSDMGHSVIDSTQGLANMVVDGTQDVLGKFVSMGAKEVKPEDAQKMMDTVEAYDEMM